jgi:2-keto-4-pentenoate hydratase
MLSFRCLLGGLLISFWCSIVAGEQNPETIARNLYASILKGPVDLLSTKYSQLSLDEADEIQDAYVQLELKSKVVGGYKAGFTSSDAQKKWGIARPVSGVLFAEGEFHGSPVIDMADYQKLFIEMEIGFVLAKEITQPVASVTNLIEYILHIVPVIELPNLPFRSLKSLTAVDLVASNMASKNWLVGQPITTDMLAGQVIAKLYQEGELIDSGTVSIRSRLEALLWLVNERLRRGWSLKSGNTLITGVMGKINLAKQACYLVDYGDLAQPLSFQVIQSENNRFNAVPCPAGR